VNVAILAAFLTELMVEDLLAPVVFVSHSRRVSVTVEILAAFLTK
jgi:hypothetical protein